MDVAIERQILDKLGRIERQVEEIKEHMVDADTILTAEERRLLDESVVREKQGKLVPLEELKNVRNKAR